MRARGLLLLLLCAPALLAQPGVDQRAYLELFVNDLSRDTVLVYLRGADQPDDALVAVEDLEKAGLHGVSGTREMRDGREFVSLRSLSPAITFRYDAEALAVRVVARPDLLESTSIDLKPVQRPQGMVLHRDTSGFFNYSITGEGRGAVSGAAELGASVRGNLAFTGLSVLPDTHQVVRGLSYLVLDDPEKLRRIQLGDAIAISSSLGGSAQLSGVSVTREFSLDPYFVRQPLPKLSGAILTPSTLDVYVNGSLVRQQQIAPGPFEVRNLPVSGGAGQVSYVVRDAFGRTQDFASPYYGASGVLADGLSEYGYHLGFRRLDFGQDSNHYGPPELLARHRIGIGNWLTAGYRFESALQHTPESSMLFSFGPTLAFALPLGELDLDAAYSSDAGASGAAGGIAYSLFARQVSVGASLRAMTAAYANLAQPAIADRPLLQALGSVGVPVFSRLSLTLEGQVDSMRDAGLSSALTLRGDAHLTRDLTLSGSVSRLHLPGDGGQFSGLVTLIYSFGPTTTADVGGSASAQAANATFGVQRSLPLGEGWAYQLRSTVDRDQSTSGFGQVQYQGPYGSYLASYTRSGGADAGLATAAGALVLVDGNVMPSRPVQEGFALVQVPGVEGVRGYLNNQEIGRTNGSGNLLIPSLQPYYGNRLRIGDADVPIDYQIGAVEQVVGTPLRGGALVRFDVQRVTNVKGAVRIDRNGNITIPSFGEMTVDARHVSPLGSEGQFWLGDLPIGRHRARVEFREGSCSMDLDVPQSEKAVVDLGTLSCRGGQLASAQ
jgi:outer membrane usher protein